MSDTDVIRATLLAAAALHERRMWERFTNLDCFGVRLPDRDEFLLACVMGESGEEYGLMLCRGPDAVAHFDAFNRVDGADSDAFYATDVMGFSMDRFGDLTPEVQAVFREAGLRRRARDQVPGFLVKPPHRLPRLPDADEWSLLRRVLAGVLRADEQRLIEPIEFDDPAGVFVLTVTGDAEDPAVTVDREVLRRDDEGNGDTADAGGFYPSGADVFVSGGLDLSGLDRIDTRWLVAAAPLPMGVADDDRSMRMLLILDEGAEQIHDAMPYFSDETDMPVKRLKRNMQQHGVPREIVFTSGSLHDTIAPTLEDQGVTCRHEPDHPAIDALMDDLLSHLGQSDLTDESVDVDWEEDSRLPADDDLDAWKAAERRLFSRFAHHVEHGERPRSSRAIKRYFNHDDPEILLENHEDRGVAMAFSNWCVLDYRPTRKSKTQAEIMLEEGLPLTQATLLQSRLNAYPSLHRVVACDADAGTVDLEDVLVGGAATVHDRALSENTDPGVFLAGRVFRAGGFSFIEAVGPPLGPWMGDDAVAFLRRKKLEFTPEGLRRDAHKLGWLWAWLDKEIESFAPPMLRNTDGENLRFHTASFVMADRKAVKKTLAKRRDVDYDRHADEYVWSSETGEGTRMMGGPVTLARMEIIDDELIVTTNSAERFERVRAWLTEIPGVRFVDVQTRDPDAPDTAAALDDPLLDEEPFEPTPEMRRDIEAHITNHYMDWLDTPLPMLNGRTPREACRDEQGRAEVATLIRTIPDPSGNVPVAVPREAMLRELGLPVGAVPDRAAGNNLIEHHPPEPKPKTPTKIGRNAPCPCGSGKKYKKCCG